MNFKILITVLIALIISANIVFAVPGIPNAFYGTVTWNGSPASDGTTTVTAKINGVQVASGTTSGGKYGYPIGFFYVDDPNSDRSGKTINFFVNGVDTGQTALFYTGAVTQLDLFASGGTTSGGSSSGGGGGGGGGGGSPSVTQNRTSQTGTTTQQCQETWTCTDWSTCKDGIQTRTCTDSSNCGTRNNEPFTSQPCSAEERKQAEQANALLPTGFFLGLSATDWLIAIVVGIIIAVVVIFILKKRSSRKK